tara:strand:- start:1026 stop:1826 length:801 start_codon:yes stop_codon:yes gene_type:complete
MSEDIPSRPTPPAEFARLSSQNTILADRLNADIAASQQRAQTTGDRFNRNDEAQIDLSPAGREALAASQAVADVDNDSGQSFNSTKDDGDEAARFAAVLRDRAARNERENSRQQADEIRRDEVPRDGAENNPVDNAARLSPAEIVGTVDAVARLDRNEDGRINRAEQARVLRTRQTGGDARLRLYQQTSDLAGAKDTNIIEDPVVDKDKNLTGFASEKAEQQADATQHQPVYREPEKIYEEVAETTEEAEKTSAKVVEPPNAGFAA